MEKRMNLLSLTWPIFIENVLFMLLGFIDIFVLSRYNDIAASAVQVHNAVQLFRRDTGDDFAHIFTFQC